MKIMIMSGTMTETASRTNRRIAKPKRSRGRRRRRRRTSENTINIVNTFIKIIRRKRKNEEK